MKDVVVFTTKNKGRCNMLSQLRVDPRTLTPAQKEALEKIEEEERRFDYNPDGTANEATLKVWRSVND